MSASLSQLIPELIPFARDLVDAAGAAGLQPRVTSTLRSYAEQKRLYNRFLAGASPYPAAPPGHSAHEYGYAFDMIVSPLSALADVGAYWEANGGIWGGRIGDDVHFEYPGFKDTWGTAIDAAQRADNVIAPAPIAAIGQTLEQVMNALPWWIQIVLPFSLVTQNANETPEQAGARLMRWVQTHF